MRIEDLKVGDSVVYFPRSSMWGPGPMANVGTVEKVTKTQVTVDGIRFLKRTGNKVGDAYGMHIAINRFGEGQSGHLWTTAQAEQHNKYVEEEKQKSIKIREIKNVTRHELDNMTLEELTAILDILNKQKEQ